MSLADSLGAGRFAVALEITPPKRSLPRVLRRRAGLLGDAPTAINVIQRPDRQSSLEAAIELQAAGIEPVWHLVTRGKRRGDLDADLLLAAERGIRNILCIRGDHAAPPEDDVTVRDACAAAAALPGSLVGATLNQYVADRAAVLRNLLPKLAAGARYVQTQPVFDAEGLRLAAEGVLERAPETRVVAMAMPLTSVDEAARIETRLGTGLPAALRERLASGDDDAIWGAFEELLAGLVESPLIAGVAIMTFNPDPEPAVGDRILGALRAAGALAQADARGPSPVE